MIRILQPEDVESILSFERERLITHLADPMEREMHEWHAPWRRESLEHYLPLGWSFGDFDDGRLKGYFIAQPQLFMRGMTQTLWVEHVAAETSEIFTGLLDVAYRTCREKHFQKLVVHGQESARLAASGLSADAVGDKLFEIKTAKF